MGIVTALVLFCVIWFMVLFIVLPLRLETQGERGEVEPGTPESAPANLDMWKKARLVTVISVIVWVVIAGVILSGVISVEDLDWTGRMNR